MVVGWGERGQIPKIAMMGACWPGAGAGSEPGLEGRARRALDLLEDKGAPFYFKE